MKLPLTQEVRPMDMLPNGYGIAYQTYNRDVSVVAPIPLNLVYAVGRKFWMGLRGAFGLWKSPYRKAYLEGRSSAREDFEWALSQFEEHQKKAYREEYVRIVDALTDSIRGSK